MYRNKKIKVMTQAIGFANKFYTLWSIDKQPVYTIDIYGKHWLAGYNTHYTYHKNISFDLERAKVLHPGLEIHEDLRGKTSSWISERKEGEDLCPHIMKFGKYYGKDITELLKEDFQYLIWICENMGYSSNGKYAKNLPEVQSHFNALEDADNKLIADRDSAFKAVVDAGQFEFIADRNLRVNEDYAFMYINEGDLHITFKFDPGTFSYNQYNGFAYGLPLVKGKAKRIKGKTVRFEFAEDTSGVYQVIVNNVEIL